MKSAVQGYSSAEIPMASSLFIFTQKNAKKKTQKNPNIPAENSNSARNISDTPTQPSYFKLEVHFLQVFYLKCRREFF